MSDITKMNLSFAGCGFLGIYHVGVAVCFKKYAPHLLLNKISGASAGAIAACCLLCDLPLGELTSDVLRVVQEARSRTLGPFSPSFNVQNVLLEGFEKVLPEDAHLRVNGKLHISLTRVYDGKNVIVSQFNSREDLMQALLASSFIPFFSGFLPPKFHGIRYMDGGFSDNLPSLDENTITVSPFCGESDICPRDTSSQLFHVNVANTSIELSRQNIYRFTRILFPPNPEILASMCKQGFDDALRFLHRNNLINCTRCLAVQSTFVVADAPDESLEYDPQCQECQVHRQEALVANLPDTVLTIFQDAIDSANKGLVNWVFKHRGMKLLSVLSLPYTLPADIVYATFTKFMSNAPELGNNLWDVSKLLLDHLNFLLQRLNKKRQQITAKLSCHLALTEYGGSKYDVESLSDLPLSKKNKMNINFTINLDERTNEEKSSSALVRRSSLTVNKTELTPMDDDTFDHILQVTTHNEAVMAYYYLDENKKVKITEIYDVTEADTTAMLTQEERENNTLLEFDDDFDDVSSHLPIDIENEYIDEDSSLYMSDPLYGDEDPRNHFSEPESEWNKLHRTRCLSDGSEPDYLPESDQNSTSEQQPLTRKPSYAILVEEP